MNTAIYEKVIHIPVEEVSLTGDLMIPEDATGLIIFSHGSGSSRMSPRNNYVAHILQEKGFATLLFDLLTEEEDRIFVKRFNIPLLTRRLESVTKWIQAYPATTGLNIGYFGASTGAASALRAAAHFDGNIKAVVSRGGRPDLAMEMLDDVDAPTLLIVGGCDDGVINLNQKALRHLAGERRLTVVENASHLFSEPGKLEEVAELAAEWFGKYL